MPVYKKQGSNKWFIKFDLEGQTYYHTPKIPKTKRALELIEAEMKASILSGTYNQQPKTNTLAAFITSDFLPWYRASRATADDAERVCRVIADHFGNATLRELETEPARIEAFQTARKHAPTPAGKPRQPATVNRELSVLSAIFERARFKGLVTSNPAHAIAPLKLDNRMLRWLTEDEERRVLRYLVDERAHLKPIIVLFLHTGMRKGELLSIRRFQINLERNTLTLLKTKTGRARTIPMNSVARAELVTLIEGKGEMEYLFAPAAWSKSLHLTEIKRGWKKACVCAGVTPIRIHDLRHTFGTRLAEAGEPLHRIAELMGHADIRTTQRYVHAAAIGTHAAVERLANRGEIVAEQKRRA